MAQSDKGERRVLHLGWFIFVCVIAAAAGYFAVQFLQMNHLLEGLIILVAMVICVLLVASVTFVRGPAEDDEPDGDVKLEAPERPLMDGSGPVVIDDDDAGHGTVAVYDDRVILSVGDEQSVSKPENVTVLPFTPEGELQFSCKDEDGDGGTVILGVTPSVKAQALASALVRVGAKDNRTEQE